MGAFGSFASRLFRSAPHLARGLANRRDLARLDLEEAWCKCVRTFVVALASMLFFSLAAAGLMVIVAAVYWDTPHRVLAVSVFAGAEAFVALSGVLWIWLGWRRWRFFQTTFEQLERDAECLARIIKDTEMRG